MKTQAFKVAGVGLLALLTGCAGEAFEPLECSSAVAGDELVVTCNQPVEAPPAYCEAVAPATYECRILHATADDCATFPGICE